MKKDMLEELHKIVKTPSNECMVLPYGNADPEDVIYWIYKLSDEEFDDLMKTNIIIQAKIFYKKVRNELKGRK